MFFWYLLFVLRRFKLANPEETRLEETRTRDFTLEAFVVACNALLAQHLPDGYDGTRAREDITVRTVRHYAGEGLIDEPQKLGREARYTHRHIVQVLVVRRLMAEGYTSKTIPIITRRNTAELEAILQGEAVEPQPGQVQELAREDALEYIQGIRARKKMAAPEERTSSKTAAPTPAESIPSPPASTPPAPSAELPEFLRSAVSTQMPRPVAWARYELSPGLELSVRDDARVPKSPNERARLLERLEALLIDLARQ